VLARPPRGPRLAEGVRRPLIWVLPVPSARRLVVMQWRPRASSLLVPARVWAVCRNRTSSETLVPPTVPNWDTTGERHDRDRPVGFREAVGWPVRWPQVL